MPNYNELGVKERAALIRAGVQNGLTRLNEIRNTYSAGALPKQCILNDSIKCFFSIMALLIG